MKSSRAPSRAGSARAAAPRARAAAATASGVAPLERFDLGTFAPTLYVEGPDEALKAAFLAELKAAWARHVPEAPRARVLQAGESGVDEILSAYRGGSLFTPRELTIVLGIELLARSEKRVAGLAGGLEGPPGASTLVLVESASEQPRKALEPLRGACVDRWKADPPSRAELLTWGARRLARAGVRADASVLETLLDACEGDSVAFFNELEKLEAFAGEGGAVSKDDALALLKPVLGADVPDYLGAVALGYPGLAAQRLGRLLAAGVGEGTVLFALSNLVGGALGGWSRHKELSLALQRRLPPASLARSMDAVYRAEAAWKSGRADAIAALEQARRAVAGAGRAAARGARASLRGSR